MGYLGATLTQVFACTRSGCVTQRCHNRNPRWETGLGSANDRFICSHVWSDLYIHMCGQICMFTCVVRFICSYVWPDLYIHMCGHIHMFTCVAKFIYSHVWPVLYVLIRGQIYTWVELFHKSCYFLFSGISTFVGYLVPKPSL